MSRDPELQRTPWHRRGAAPDRRGPLAWLRLESPGAGAVWRVTAWHARRWRAWPQSIAGPPLCARNAVPSAFGPGQRRRSWLALMPARRSGVVAPPRPGIAGAGAVRRQRRRRSNPARTIDTATVWSGSCLLLWSLGRSFFSMWMMSARNAVQDHSGPSARSRWRRLTAAAGQSGALACRGRSNAVAEAVRRVAESSGVDWRGVERSRLRSPDRYPVRAGVFLQYARAGAGGRAGAGVCAYARACRPRRVRACACT